MLQGMYIAVVKQLAITYTSAMAIFLVAADTPNLDLKNRIREQYPNDYFEINPSLWLISADKVTRQLADELGIPGGSLGRAVVFLVDSYNGWHKKSLWEWVKLKNPK